MSILKEGFLQRYKRSFLSNKWKSCYAILYSDSTICLYDERGDSKPVESIFLKNVVPYICVGMMTDRMPVKRPDLPSGTAIQRLVGIGMDPQASKIHWLLFPSEQILEEWFNVIVTTLPKPANPPPSQLPPSQLPQPNSNQNAYIPPAKYPDAPPPAYSSAQPNAYPSPQYGGSYPQQQPGPYQQPYQQQPYGQQTVIIDRTSDRGYSSGGGGFGSGLGAGLGGAMLGGLMGYGIGSFFAPHYGGGFGGYGGGFGAPYGGMGGAYVQDNDTYTTNNYYMNSDDHSTSTPAVNAGGDGDYSQPTVNDYGGADIADYDGGGGSWADDIGGGDFGGGDFGGGDFGGGGDW